MVNELKAPLPDEVQRMVEQLCDAGSYPSISETWATEAADMIKRLAKDVEIEKIVGRRMDGIYAGIIRGYEQRINELNDWNKMLADHNEQLAQRGDVLEERLAR